MGSIHDIHESGSHMGSIMHCLLGDCLVHLGLQGINLTDAGYVFLTQEETSGASYQEYGIKNLGLVCPTRKVLRWAFVGTKNDENI